MEQALKSGVWRAVGLTPAHRGPWCWGLRYRSTRERRPPPFAPPAAGGREEGPPRGRDGGGQLPPPALPEVSGAVADPHSSREGLAPQSWPRPWHKRYERGARQAAPANAELWSSREGDFSKARKRLERKPLSIERTKGSEILFGIAPCSLALSQSRRDLFRLFLKQSSGARRLVMSEFVLQATARGVPVHHVRRRELDALCRGQVHQGVCLEATPLHFKSLEEAEKPDSGDEESPTRQLIWLVLEQIQDPMNLGALLRSAYFLGVDRVVTSQRNSCPLTPTVSKASSGVMEVFDVYSTGDLRSFLKAKTAEGWEVVGTVSKPEDVEDVPVVSCLEFRWNKPVIIVSLSESSVTALVTQAEAQKPLVLENRSRETGVGQEGKAGSEGDGLSLETQLLCHRMLTIPAGRALHPGIESLNVSVATGILLHSICSQKLRHGD
ncbi:PREDICTED: rRNA methyltransferase 1, mitochondrial [Nipponia nippon]|uniref:rRNA methyltransferase 1, mitochondrial n=1 Tax=Nipponia nippon TaxID=128390 RepID=UPI0005108C61|nr:PREDICTED: rRNA methyltransferase 1, mitochondrial [Nipponia nippon]